MVDMYLIEDKSAAIREIQRLLEINQSGNYDSRTFEAVKSHQLLKGLPATGQVDYETFKSIHESFRYKNVLKKSAGMFSFVTRFPYQIGYSGEDVALINSLLSNVIDKFGLNYIKPKGRYFSVRSASAVKRLREIFMLEDGYHVDEPFFEILLKQ